MSIGGPYPEAAAEAYTWWSNRGQAWAKNVGWRIDYQIASPGLAAMATGATVYKDAALLRPRAADIDYSWPLAAIRRHVPHAAAILLRCDFHHHALPAQSRRTI